jgi:hypothetical protein
MKSSPGTTRLVGDVIPAAVDYGRIREALSGRL